MKKVCDRHGALFILDEVMSGMGRCGTLHAWEQEGVVPDLQTVAKGLGGGYASIGALLVNKRVIEALDKGSGGFIHSQTYQGHPVACAAAYEVQKIIKEENLLQNVRSLGEYLGNRLKEQLGDHKHVGDIRGRGFFWGVSINLHNSSDVDVTGVGKHLLISCVDRVCQGQSVERAFHGRAENCASYPQDRAVRVLDFLYSWCRGC